MTQISFRTFLFSRLAMMFSPDVSSDKINDFVEKARLRIERQDIVPTLFIPNDSLVPLDKALNESSESLQSLFYVDGGEYAGCLVDRRNVRGFANRGKAEWIKSETERVSRMMAEDPQDKDDVSSSNVPVFRSCGVAFPDRFGDFHDVVFRLPQGSQMPQTLRRALASPDLTPNLRTRATLAFNIATVLSIFRRLGVAHMRIRPEPIVLVRRAGESGLSSDGYSPSLGTPFLSGFVQTKHLTIDSEVKAIYGLSTPEFVYYHPHVIMVSHRRAYQMDDDIYSLGVCLLEIGLWRSLVYWDEEKSQYDNDQYWKLDLLDFIGPDKTIPGNLHMLRMSRLLEITNRELPLVMGPKYASIVSACLEFGMKNVKVHKEADSPQLSGLEFITDIIAKLFELKTNL